MPMELRVPAVKDLRQAVEIFHRCPMLGNSEIKRIFGCGDNVALRLRRAAERKMEELGHPSWSPTKVNTDDAFAAWGLDIKRMEGGLQRLRRLGMEVECE